MSLPTTQGDNESQSEGGSMTSLEFRSLIGLKDYRDSLVAALQPPGRRLSVALQPPGRRLSVALQPPVRRLSAGIIGLLGAVSPVRQTCFHPPFTKFDFWIWNSV